MSAAAHSLPRSMAGPHNPWLVAVVVSLATFMEVLDTTIVVVALDHIAGNLSTSYDEATWVLTSYLVANAIILPVSGWLASVLGRKPFYMGCVALFTVSSVLCGFAPSLTLLVVFRVLQGLGGGGLAPSAASILRDSFPPRQQGMVFALYGIVVVAAPALGPAFGGWLTDHYSWHWVFLINLPVGIVAATLSFWLLVEPELETRERQERWRRGLRIDYVGFVLVALGLGCLQVVLDRGERADWFSSDFILAFSAIAAVALTALVVRELAIEEPVVDLPLLRDRGFLAANIVRFGTFLVLVGSTQLLPQMTQSLFDYDAMEAGLVLTPGALVVMLITPLSGYLINKVQVRFMIGFGLLLEAAALHHMSGFTTEMSFAHIMWARIFQAVGLAFLIVPITTVAFLGIPGSKTNNASALLNLTRNLGGSFGISLAQTWLANRAQFHQDRLIAALTPYDATYRETVHSLRSNFAAQGSGPVLAHDQALAQIYRLMQRQAMIMSYNDLFWLAALGMLLMVPLIFLLHRRH
jgi:DHA2 family multidrug resistance protein